MKDYIEIPVKEYKLLVEKAMKYDLMKTEVKCHRASDQNEHKAIRKMRTIEQAYNDLKEIDPGTAITKNCIRDLVLGGHLPFLQVKSKRLIDLDDLMEYIGANMKDMAERQGVR